MTSEHNIIFHNNYSSENNKNIFGCIQALKMYTHIQIHFNCLNSRDYIFYKLTTTTKKCPETFTFTYKTAWSSCFAFSIFSGHNRAIKKVL